MKKEKQVNEYSPWVYKGEVVTEAPADVIGFVYIVKMYSSKDAKENVGEYYTVPKIYIGKKMLTSTIKKKIGKRAIAAERASRADGKAKTVKRVTKSSNWQQYTGSCAQLNKDIEQYPENYTREILHWCWSKKNMSYWETAEQIKAQVLHTNSYNDHIQNWYRHDTDIELYKQHLERMKTIVRKPHKKKDVPG